MSKKFVRERKGRIRGAAVPKVDRQENVLWRRCGGALGLAYAMHDRGEPKKDVRAQLREARAIAFAERPWAIPGVEM